MKKKCELEKALITAVIDYVDFRELNKTEKECEPRYKKVKGLVMSLQQAID